MWVCYLSHLSLADEPVFCLPLEGSRIDLTWREGNTRRRRRNKKKGETVEEVESPWKWPVFIRRQNPFTLFCRCEKHDTTFQGGVLARFAPPFFLPFSRTFFFFFLFVINWWGAAIVITFSFLNCRNCWCERPRKDIHHPPLFLFVYSSSSSTISVRSRSI